MMILNISDNWYTVSGLIITTLSFVLGVYFVYSAIRAYEQIKQLEKLILEGNTLKKSLSDQEKYQNSVLMGTFDKHIDLLRRIGDTSGIYKDVSKTISSLELEKARMAISMKEIDGSEVQQGLYKLVAIGENTDLVDLQVKLSKDFFDEDLVETVKYVISALRSRLKG